MAEDQFDEKEEEKRDEKNEKDEKEFDEKDEKDEKEHDEKWADDPLSRVVWALILIWAGLVLLAGNLGYLDRWIGYSSDVPGLEFLGKLAGTWSLIFLGAGLIVLGETVIRLLVPAYRRSITGTLIFGVVLVGIGLGDLWDWGIMWAVALIVAGVVLLARGLRRS